MPTQSGYSNRKMFGQNRHLTVQSVGSDRLGMPAPQMYVYELTPVALAITSVLKSKDGKRLRVQLAAPHNANSWDMMRIVTGNLVAWEFEIIAVSAADTFDILNIGDINGIEELPQVGDTLKTLRWTTALSDAAGALQVSNGPAQFVKNGATQTVVQDTAVPANNAPLPAGLYIVKDGVVYPVTKDTSTPSNTLAIPVEIVQASGSPITFTAGDINIQLSHLGANFDSTRLGDGTNLVAITAAGEMKVLDSQSLAQLALLVAKDFSTSAKQDLAKSVLDNILTSVDGLEALFGTLNGSVATAANQATSKAVLDNILAALIVLEGYEDGVETLLTAISGKLPATLGQKSSANSLAVVLPNDQTLVTDSNAFLDFSGSTNALNGLAIASTDVSKYKEIILGISGSYTGVLTFQGSPDNATWYSVNGTLVNTGTNVPTQFISGASGMFKIPVVFKYFRVQMTAYTSGTANAVALATSGASTDLAMKTVSAQQSGTWNIGTVTTITNPVTTSSASTAGTISSAQITVGTSAVRATVAGTAPNAARKLLMIKPSKNNAGAIYYGPSTVTTANGMEIIGPDAREFDFDAGDYYLISDTAGQTVEILEKV